MKHVDAVIIGGGPAGLAAAIELRKKGIDDILILEREKKPGGILRQCIHDGFGLTRFGETLSGPEYAARILREAEALHGARGHARPPRVRLLLRARHDGVRSR